jgi:hypothetical protein
MAMTLITTNTSSDAASSDFTSSIDNTYKLYIFKFYDVEPETESVYFSFQGSTDGGSNYDTTMTTTNFIASHREDDGGTTQLIYRTGNDQAEGSAFQLLCQSMGVGGADESAVGELHLFNPSNTTYVKHFYCTAQHYQDTPGSQNSFTAGYFNTTSAIDAVSFKMSSDNMDGTIKMYGVG